jgi:hypothetical protein
MYLIQKKNIILQLLFIYLAQTLHIPKCSSSLLFSAGFPFTGGSRFFYWDSSEHRLQIKEYFCKLISTAAAH